jgi:TonB-linked SusC/RagA family outer membrane protein
MKMYNFYVKILCWPKRHIPKTLLAKKQLLRIMKLTIVLLIATIMQVSATGFAQKLTLSHNKVSVKQIFKEIKKQTGYDVFYLPEVMNDKKTISVNFSNAPLEDVMEKCLEGQPLIFSIFEKSIVVKQNKSLVDKLIDYFLNIDVKGRVIDQEGNPLTQATIKVKGTNHLVTSNEKGEFTLTNIDEDAILQVSYLGYAIKEIKVAKEMGDISLVMATGKLEEVSVVSTGYQTLPKERATGSFVQIDNALINRSVSTNILDRLEGVTSGLLYNRNTVNTAYRNQNDINIRGRSTIFANDQPLIIVDNFPFDGNINNINPNDVESITILRDAAAASIWGARAGNGVIVITTKRGKENQPLRVSLNSNITVGAKPDLFYNPNFLSSSDYIDVEQRLFAAGFYTADENSSVKPPLSPVVELLIQNRTGAISNTETSQRLDAFKQLDVRRDFEKYLYQQSINQQYALNLNGGSEKATYMVSSGYDRNRAYTIGTAYDRLTLNSFNTFKPFKNLEITAGMNYILSNSSGANSGWGNNPRISAVNVGGNSKNIYPYAQLADELGNPLSIVKNYRNSYLNTLAGGKLLDWNYYPLSEMNLINNSSKVNDIRINTAARYNFDYGLSADVKYQYQKALTTNLNFNGSDSFFSRNLVNQFTMGTGPFTYKIPQGGILNRSINELNSSIIRGQLNYDRIFSLKHQISLIAGAEIREVNNNTSNTRMYGYDDGLALGSKVDYATAVNLIYPYALNNQFVPFGDSSIELKDRYRSLYSNVAYTYDNRYIVSGSVRKDESNLFGVRTNQKGVPLWSAGLSWNISNEKFYTVRWLPSLKLRTTFGYNGNVDRSLTAFTTAIYSTDFLTGARNASIQSPGNPDLRWERVKIINIGLDFASKNQILSGSVDYYSKNGLDIIGDAPVPPATGFANLKGNLASTKGHGIDVILNAAVIRTGKFRWQSNFLLSHAVDKVSKYKGTVASAGQLVSYADGISTNLLSNASLNFPVEGNPVFSVYSYRWGGLDNTGDPQGYVNGALSKDYATLVNPAVKDLVFHGSARPTYFGSFRNNISYDNFSLSFNILYKLGYYFRTTSIAYDLLFTNWVGHKDYAARWQKPGDENTTNVPSLKYPEAGNRSNFYTGSQVLVEKADNIRLQDIQIGYDFKTSLLKQISVKNLRLFLYASNLGIIWKANNKGLDPDAGTFPQPMSISAGLRADF